MIPSEFLRKDKIKAIVKIQNLKTDEIYLLKSNDAVKSFKDERFKLDLGMHESSSLQKAYTDLGLELFVIEIDKEVYADENLIILDDAFQHRYVKPSLSILLTEYGHPLFEDRLLPLGRLRESIQAVNRAEIVVVTKCPEDIKPVNFRLFKKNLNLFPYQKLFFSRFKYDSLVPVFPAESTYVPLLELLTAKDTILTITGIANPKPLVRYLKEKELAIAIDKTKAEQVQKAVEAALKKAGFNLYTAENEEHIQEGIMKGYITEEQAAQIREIKATVAEQKAANLPEQMIQNIANGRMNKFYKESCLLEQAFIMDEKATVKSYLASIDADLTAVAFKRVNLNED